MPKYVVIFWKNLYKNNVSMRSFEDEHDLANFVESKSDTRYNIIVGESVMTNSQGDKIYRIKPFGVYQFFKKIYFFISVFLFLILISIILIWIYDFK